MSAVKLSRGLGWDYQWEGRIELCDDFPPYALRVHTVKIGVEKLDGDFGHYEGWWRWVVYEKDGQAAWDGGDPMPLLADVRGQISAMSVS